jgi:hypothetical protein
MKRFMNQCLLVFLVGCMIFALGAIIKIGCMIFMAGWRFTQ